FRSPHSLSSLRFLHSLCCFVLFLFYRSADPLDLPSFPTRRSSDLALLRAAGSLPRPCARPRLRNWLCSWHLRHDRILLVETGRIDRKSTRLNSSHEWISYAVFCLKKKKKQHTQTQPYTSKT